jgi:hypothetical protein
MAAYQSFRLIVPAIYLAIRQAISSFFKHWKAATSRRSAARTRSPASTVPEDPWAFEWHGAHGQSADRLARRLRIDGIVLAHFAWGSAYSGCDVAIGRRYMKTGIQDRNSLTG